MSKKTLLNEATIRRFGGLAGIKPATTSTFLTEVEVGEDELADALAAGAEAMADTLGLDVAVDVEGGEDAGEEIDDLEGDFGELEGEEDEIEDEIGGLEGEEDAIDDEEGFIDDEEDAIEDETLDELINRILQEDEEEDHYRDNEEEDRKHLDDLEKDMDFDERRDEGTKKGGRRKDAGHAGERLAYDEGTKKGGRRKDAGHAGERLAYDEGHIRVLDDEYIMQEVSRRVKTRLANLVKESRRRKRQTKRRK